MTRKVIVGAHYGLGSWLGQRVTAAAMAVYTVIFVLAVIAEHPTSYTQWRQLFSPGWMKFAGFLFVITLFYHAWVGVRNIFMDYVKPPGIRLFLHAVSALLLLGYAGWALRILWGA